MEIQFYHKKTRKIVFGGVQDQQQMELYNTMQDLQMLQCGQGTMLNIPEVLQYLEFRKKSGRKIKSGLDRN